MEQKWEVNGDCVYHTEATEATFLQRASSMVTGSPSDATADVRMTTLVDPMAFVTLLLHDYASDVHPTFSTEGY